MKKPVSLETQTHLVSDVNLKNSGGIVILSM